MRSSMVFTAIALLSATTSYAQPIRGYVGGEGGFATAPDGTSGDVLGEAGVRIAPHLLVFGDVGRIRNLQPSSLQPQVDLTTTLLAASNGLNVAGTAHAPATYTLGGVRYEAPMRGRVSPYVFGGAGVAHIAPTAQFTYNSGTISGINPVAGDTSDTSLSWAPGLSPPQANVPGMTRTPGLAPPTFAYVWNAYQAYDDAFVTRGLHSLKFGVGVERDQLNETTNTADYLGTFQFGTLAAFLANAPKRVQGVVPGLATPRYMRVTIAGTYVQDGDKFAATVAVRRHTQGPPSVFGIDNVDITLSGKSTLTTASLHS